MLMNWRFVTSTQYHNGTPVDGDMYFLSDTREIYRGTEPFTESVVLYTELPVSGIAINRLYINSTTLEGKIYDGSKWITVIRPISDMVDENDTNPVSGKAVAAFVAAEISKISTSGTVISSLSWDSAEHLLEITKGNAETESIVFDGLGVSLNYKTDTGELQLADAKGNLIGDVIKLDLERFVTAGEYDPDTSSIILYFDAEKTESVTIPVADLVDTYTAEGDGKSLSLTVEGNRIKGSIKISTAAGNIITADENGLYVGSIDISGKMDKDTAAVKNNIAVFDENGNAVDSGKTFADITPNNKVYEGSTLEEAVTGSTPTKGDFAVISEPIGETGKVQITVHQYDGENWIAHDSYYDASKVILPEDWISTTKIGVLQTLTNGQVTIAKAGTDVLTALRNFTLKESQPSVTQPSVSFSNSSDNEFKAYEVGTQVPISLTASLSSGTYQYGRIDTDGNFDSSTSAGISAKSWTFTDSNGVEKTGSNSTTFDTIEVTDDIEYSVTAKATYDASAYTPATNLKKPASVAGISAGSKSKTTANITGYRNCFYGTLTHKNDLTSTIIRSLTSTNSAVTAGNELTISIPVGCLRAVIAYPSDATTLDALSSVKDANASDAQINTAFSLVKIDVEGAEGYTAKEYKVFYKDFADPVTAANTYKITL